MNDTDPALLLTLHPIPWSGTSAFLNASAVIHAVQIDRRGRVVGWNVHAAEVFDLERGIERSAAELVVLHAAPAFEEWLATEAPKPAWFDFVDRSQNPFSLHCHLHGAGELRHVLAAAGAADDSRLNQTLLPMVQELALLSRESSRKTRELGAAKTELDRVHQELKNTYWHLKKIQEVISICMTCGRIKTDEESWSNLSQYLLENGIFATHGLCPTCADKFNAELDDEEAELGTA